MKNIFLDKIINEEKIICDTDFSVVYDLYPIMQEHYLLFPNYAAASLADVNVKLLKNFISNVLVKAFDNERYMLFERGRANFCTSIDGVIHAHAHLMPLNCDYDMFFDLPAIVRHDDLFSALKYLSPDEQYLLWGNLGREFYTIQPLINAPKRIIRNTIDNHLRNRVLANSLSYITVT